MFLGGNPNLVSVNNQFVTIGSPLELSCNVSGIAQHDIDMYHIANHTAHNVTNKRTDKSVIAEFGSVTRHDNFGWYCCCQGNCYNGSIGSVLVFVGGMIFYFLTYYHISNNIGGVMVSVLTSSAINRWFEPLSSRTIKLVR